MSKITDKIKSTDSNVLWKWGLLIGAGLLSLLASVFDTKHKDQLYEKKLDEEIAKSAKRLTEEKAA